MRRLRLALFTALAALLLLVPSHPLAQGPWTQLTVSGVVVSGAAPGWSDNYGTAGMTVDPSCQGCAVFGADHQGIWRTTNAGDTWTQIYDNGATSGFDGYSWSMAWTTTGAYALSNNGYGTTGGIWRTTDGGATWSLRQGGDINAVAISPTDETHAMATSHSVGGSWYESTNSGVSWTDLGAGPGMWHYLQFLDDNTVISLGPDGLWQAKKASGSWTWTQRVSGRTGPHGGAQFCRDTGNGYFYAAVGEPREMYRTTLANRGDSWTKVADQGAGYATATVFCTPGRIYAQANFATHLDYDEAPWQASATAGDTWSTGPSVPAEMTNGAHGAAVVCNGTNYVILTANTNSGIWRYVTTETCGSGGSGGGGTIRRFRMIRGPEAWPQLDDF